MRIRDPKTTALIFASGKMARARRCAHLGPILGLRSQSLRDRFAAARRASGAASPACLCHLRARARCALALTPPHAAGGDGRKNGGHGEACSAQVCPHHSEAAVPGAVQGARRASLAAAQQRRTDSSLPLQDFTIQNIVASCDVRFPIRLEGLSYAHPQFSNVRCCGARSLRARRLTELTHCALPQYEPELFPGLIYRMVTPKIVILIFVSGKVVLTGGKARRRRFPVHARLL